MLIVLCQLLWDFFGAEVLKYQIYLHTHTHTHTHTYIRTHKYRYIYVYVYGYISIHKHVYSKMCSKWKKLWLTRNLSIFLTVVSYLLDPYYFKQRSIFLNKCFIFSLNRKTLVFFWFIVVGMAIFLNVCLHVCL